VEDGIIIVIVERVLETILKVKILLNLSIQVAATLRSDLLDIVAVVDRTRRGPTTMIGSKRGLPHVRSRSIKWSKLMDRMLRTRIRGLLHWNSNGATGTLKSFFVCINNGITTNIERRLM
jgi:hypothetical protein